jgi:hypothetical protein
MLYSIAPANTETTIIATNPTPALLTCGTTSPAAAPTLPLAPAPVPLALIPLAVELAPPVGVPVAVAVLFPLQKIVPGLMPFSMKQFCSSDTLCCTLRQ